MAHCAIGLSLRRLAFREVLHARRVPCRVLCAYCEKPIRLFRSAGDYRNLYCPNGPCGQHGCKLKASKSARIVEESLLRFIREQLFTDSVLADLVRRANAFLAQEAARPREDVRPRQAKARNLRETIDRLVRKVEATEDKTLCDGYDRRIKELQRELNDLRAETAQIERRNQPPPKRLDEARAQTYLEDLRAVLRASKTTL